jgi:adenylate cyclase class IV
MFEVEKKFLLSKKDITRLIQGADFLGDTIFTDTYYDTDQFALTKNDMWLRNRSGRWELKIPKYINENRESQQYQEIEGEENLRQIFDIVKKSDFAEDIGEFGHRPFCVCETRRRKFKKEGFTIDLDEVKFDPNGKSEKFDYALVEIELMVESEKEMSAAVEAIEIFAKKSELKNLPVRGKVVEYLKMKKPDHYNALIQAGVIKI